VVSRSSSSTSQAASAQRGPSSGAVLSGARTSLFKESIGPANDALEREADRIADAVLSGDMQHAARAGGWSAAQRRESATIRRALSAREDAAPSQAVRTAAPATATDLVPAATARPDTAKEIDAAVPAAADAAARLVADEANPGPGQMKKSAFMAALRADICANVDAALAGTGRDSQGCPWIDHWLGYYEERPVADIERALRRYAPEAAAASEANAYIRIVAARVRRSAQRWARTGEITDLPPDMPDGMPGGVLAGFGGMFFKARAGGARPAEASSVQRQLGAGESLPGGLRARMEAAFGTGFAGVRLHADATAARLSNKLNARAFTIGPHVAFAGGEFRPGTLAGDALIAHELAHVVQQGHGSAAPMPMQKDHHSEPAGPSNQLEHDADVCAANATARLWGGGGPARSAKPRLSSGLRLQRCASSPKVAAGPDAKAKLTVRQERDAAIAGAGERLRKVDSWASLQQKMQNVPSTKGVLNLDKEQAKNVEEALRMLTQASGLFATKAAEALPGKLDEIVKFVKAAGRVQDADTGDAMTDLDLRQQRKLPLINASNASDEATDMVAKIGLSLDVSEISKHTDAIASMLNDIQSNPSGMGDRVRDIEKEARAAKQKLAEMRRLFDKTPRALERIVFVLRSFLVLNAPGRVAAPTTAEIKAYTGTPHGSLADDFSTVFGEGKSLRGFDVFVDYAEVLEQQLAVREKMAAAKVEAASPIPTQGNAEDHFKSLKGKSNEEVIAAYQAYAAAYFYHRVVDKFDDMNVSGVAELYQRPLSIFGLRPLVCTGYAMLGAHLLKQAGATLKQFVVAVRATEDEIVNNRIGIGHALAHLTRKGQNLWVTNGTIEASKADAQSTVGWNPKDPTLHEATGSTVPEANAKLASALGKLGEKVEKRAPKKK
jgi:hypothetical protein